MNENTALKLRPLPHIESMADLVQTAGRLGSYFFTADTLKFWGSTLGKAVRVAESNARREDGAAESLDVLFITREKFYEAALGHQAWTLRVAHVHPVLSGDDTIDFNTIGELGAYTSSRGARRALDRVSLVEWTNPLTYTEKTLA